MDFCLRLFLLLSIVALKTLGLVIEHSFTTPKIGFKSFVHIADFWQYVVDINKHGLDLSGITTLTFKVKACHGVRIIMSNSDDGDSSKPMYNFEIGSNKNQRSGFQRRNDDSLTLASKKTVFYDTPGVCSCDEYRPFWISVINGVLMIGKGLIVGINVIAEWIDPNPFIIRSIGLITGQTLGEWKVQIE
ncbi:Hypothetical predicted protein, partial [Mytilus galloprovincialis]